MTSSAPFRVLIADDEPLSRDYLRTLIEQDHRFEVVSVCESGVDAVAFAQESPVNIAFLDIRMPGLDGFQTLEMMRDVASIVVFVTAYSDYAVRAFEFGAFDYVTKPIDPARLAQTLDRIDNRMHERGASTSGSTVDDSGGAGDPAAKQKRVLSGVRKDLVCDESEIEVIESHGNYVEVRVRGEACRVRESMESFCRDLDSPPFVRVHRSFVVNIKNVRSISYGKSGAAELALIDGYTIPVSRRHRNEVAEILRSTLAPDE